MATFKEMQEATDELLRTLRAAERVERYRDEAARTMERRNREHEIVSTALERCNGLVAYLISGQGNPGEKPTPEMRRLVQELQ